MTKTRLFLSGSNPILQQKAGRITTALLTISFTTVCHDGNINHLSIARSITGRSGFSMIAAEFADKVLQLLASVGETDEVLTNLDLPLYDYQVLDSMRTVQLILMIEEQFGLRISPAEFERERWRTPRAVIADLQQRMRM
jgi:D-alanine--poly(phosphoribitol) ligase subunit 2